MIQKLVSIYVKFSVFTNPVLYVHRLWRGYAATISRPSKSIQMQACYLSKGHVQIQVVNTWLGTVKNYYQYEKEWTILSEGCNT